MPFAASRPVQACEVPEHSVLDRHEVERADFRDAYRAELSRPDASAVEIFFSVFGHHPGWMKRALILRNRLAAALGLEVPPDADILQPRRQAHYAPGDQIGPWPVFAVSPTELIAGRDNHHLDFRVSVLRETQGGRASTVISTICNTHNRFGKAYLWLIVPFHRWGVQLLIARALRAGRL